MDDKEYNVNHCGLDARQEDPAPGSPPHGVEVSESGPIPIIFPNKVAEKISTGIRMERERVIRLLMSPQYRHAPAEDAAMVIHNGIHWSDLGGS